MPKLPALLQVVSGPVASAYVFVFMVLLFRQGVRLVTAGGFGYERGLIVCISFWVGLGFQFGAIFADHLPDCPGARSTTAWRPGASPPWS